MADILIVYSSTDGHTQAICERLRQVIGQHAHRLSVVSIEKAGGVDLDAFDKIVIGASIRYGKHNPLVRQFINRNQALLERKPSAFFSVNVVARKPEKNQPETNPYFQKFLKTITWRPRHGAVFAGKIDYPRYRPFDRFMIRLILWITHGPTDPKGTFEFTDWRQVEDFGRLIAAM